MAKKFLLYWFLYFSKYRLITNLGILCLWSLSDDKHKSPVPVPRDWLRLASTSRSWLCWPQLTLRQLFIAIAGKIFYSRSHHQSCTCHTTLLQPISKRPCVGLSDCNERSYSLDCLDDNFLVQHITTPTRGDAILDLIITDEPNISIWYRRYW